MVKVTYGADSYYFQDGNWYGFRRGKAHTEKSRVYPGNNTRAPLCVFPDLHRAALSQGVDPSLLARPKPNDLKDEITEEKPKSRKSRRSAKKKSNPNSISIF